MFCIKCGTKLPDESIYCMKCGEKLPFIPDFDFSSPEPSEKKENRPTITQPRTVNEDLSVEHITKYMGILPYHIFTYRNIPIVERSINGAGHYQFMLNLTCNKKSDDVRQLYFDSRLIYWEPRYGYLGMPVKLHEERIYENAGSGSWLSYQDSYLFINKNNTADLVFCATSMVAPYELTVDFNAEIRIKKVNSKPAPSWYKRDILTVENCYDPTGKMTPEPQKF